MASSGPHRAWCASTTIAPTLASVALNPCPRPGVAARMPRAARPPAVTSRLAKRDVVTDADVGRERGDHRALPRQRELDGAPRFCVVRTVALARAHDVDRRVAAW